MDDSEEYFILAVSSLSTEMADCKDHTSTLGNGVSELSETVDMNLQPALPAHLSTVSLL